MHHLATRYGLLVLPFFMLGEPAQASTWQICNLELRITQVLKHPYPQLQAQVLKASPASPAVECPPVGSELTFTPETRDYQRTLPRRQWPAKGQSAHLNYRYLDGVCKGDGHSHACRIKHYSIVGP